MKYLIHTLKRGIAVMMLIQTTNATVISPFTLFSGDMLTIRDISQTSIIPIKEDDTGYTRDLTESYLTAPERFSVDATQEYSSFINHTPFYQFPYMDHIKSYWKIFGDSWKTSCKKRGIMATLTSPSTLMNTFIGLTLTTEYAAKSLVSLPARLLYGNHAPAYTKALVKDPLHQVEDSGNITILKTYPDTSIKLIRLPRYKAFLREIAQLEKSEVTLLEIAGQKEIQIKVSFEKNSNPHFNQIAGCNFEYEWNLPTQPRFTYAALTVEVRKLLNVLKNLKNQNITIVYIHDF